MDREEIDCMTHRQLVDFNLLGSGRQLQTKKIMP